MTMTKMSVDDNLAFRDRITLAFDSGLDEDGIVAAMEMLGERPLTEEETGIMTSQMRILRGSYRPAGYRR